MAIAGINIRPGFARFGAVLRGNAGLRACPSLLHAAFGNSLL
jgi:hypothetical protein